MAFDDGAKQGAGDGQQTATAVLGTPRPAPASPPPPPAPTAASTAVALLAPHAAAEGVETVAGEPRLLNRELSRLDYYARVLSNGGDQRIPLLERARFVAFFSSYLDELFQVQVAGLKDQVAAGLGATSPDGLSPVDQLRLIHDRLSELVQRQSELFVDDLVPALASAGIRFSSYDELDETDCAYLDGVFEHRIFPVITPLAVDPGHPFPYISNLSLNLAITVRDEGTGQRRFARVKVPPLLPRFVVMPDGERFVPLEQVIAAHLDVLFPGMHIEERDAFRVTRNADLTVEEEDADDLLVAVEMELRRRRFGRAVRLEVEPGVSEETLELLMRELELGPSDVYTVEGLLDLAGLWAIVDLDRPDLKDDVWSTQTQPLLASAEDTPSDIFSVLRHRDVMVHHPYDSFTTSVEEFIKQAAADPAVLAIKQTLHRTSGDSPIVNSLIRAAERGKQVAALVELKARFDEQANINWAKQLEEAGVHVVYGLVGLKTHSKTALVIREEADGIRRYWHVGTGNYNPKTARVYEDVGLLSADPLLGADLSELFNFLTGYSRQVDYRKILVAPLTLRDRIIDLIEREVAAPAGTGHIIMKMNSLSDSAVIDALYAASDAGVRVELIVRGICCVRPGVPGLSDNIVVRSIVGRFLEHSRIFCFANGPDGRSEYYIGSADMMPRNLDRRIEVIIPVEDPDNQSRLQEILDLNLADDTLAWQQDDAVWTRVPTVNGVSAQKALQELALERARRRREPDALAPTRS
ncbi:MAG TPA: RNA degradosome polyphosphate kinase [Acidimicrobiales bacterium]|nr:RNA degradosome polyphosphate kinase [Acidimicrobiales bacterium]